MATVNRQVKNPKSLFTPLLKPQIVRAKAQIVRAKAQITLYNPQIPPILTPMSNARRAARQAALLLAAYTRDTDLDDASFSRAADNAAQYYGANVSQTLAMFDDLTADEYYGCTAESHTQTAESHTQTAESHTQTAESHTQTAEKGAPWQ